MSWVKNNFYSALETVVHTIGVCFSIFENFYGKVKDLRVYNEALTDAELQELTTI